MAGDAENAAVSDRRWWGRLRPALLVVAVLVGAFLLVIAVLWVTTPDPRAQSPGWQRVADAPTSRGEVASTTGCVSVEPCREDRLYILAGIAGLGSVSVDVTVYDPAQDRWEDLPDLPEPRHHAAAAVLDDTLYLLGGSTDVTSFEPESTGWSLAPDEMEWRELPPMPGPRMGHQLMALDGRVFVVGGEGGTSVLALDPDTGWSSGAAIPRPRDHLMAVTLDGEIWAIGGRDDALSPAVDIYDPQQNAWRRGPDLPRGVSAAVAGVLDDGIHVVGGEDPEIFGGGIIDRHLVLPTGGQRWEDAPPPLVAVHGAAGGVLSDRLVVSGGSRRQGSLSVLGWTALTATYTPR